MREIEFCRKYLNPGGDNNYEVVYYITVDEILGNDGIQLENYGLGIKLNNGEEDKIRGITVSEKKIETLLNALANGTVTPVGLRDTLFDMLEVFN